MVEDTPERVASFDVANLINWSKKSPTTRLLKCEKSIQISWQHAWSEGYLHQRHL